MKKLLVAIAMVVAGSAHANDPIVTDSTSRNTSSSTSVNTNNSTSETKNFSRTESEVKSPPPTAVAPPVTTINNDVCAVVASGAVQTQIFGFSMGGTFRDLNCERIKLSKNLFDMGMKVAAVATLCQDERVFTAMIAAGTPCPVDGKIGAQAKAEWDLRDLESDDKNVGFYSSKPKSQPVSGCDYTGDDPIVIARVCK